MGVAPSWPLIRCLPLILFLLLHLLLSLPPPSALSLTLADTAPSFTASFLNSLLIQRATISSLLLLKSWPSRRRRSSDPMTRSSDPVMTADEQIITLDVDPDESIESVKALLEVECEFELNE